MKTPAALAVGLLVALAGPALAAKPLSDAARLRQQAEHVCYNDVQKLCADAIPDEDKIKTCMQVKHASLSPDCAKIYDQGIGD
ncbi:hypothetical protein [Lichenibacterium ramalinae]|uniref:3',5'-cyclic-nucleotide phosphodiesterase n=1 Tax=Lichenibacterium ramalinae TaxID=2316527 RepID=A0A4Q2REM5_9HYPH|nr:hypothetical protein [Lichenibacterium ramalinae]RYB05611.1 hypothetical protein D3272_08350 [Lichenibacterium ramalinae]